MVTTVTIGRTTITTGTTTTITTGTITTATTTETITTTATEVITGIKVTGEMVTTETMEETGTLEITGNKHFKAHPGITTDLPHMASPQITPEQESKTHSGTYSGRQACSINHSSTSKAEKTPLEGHLGTNSQNISTDNQDTVANRKICLSAETLNCHGFTQASSM